MSFRVYRSSAGSGKTYTLVLEYLKIALGKSPDAYRQILAITFTNKAASEMKERVLLALREFAHSDPKLQPPSPLFQTLQSELGLSEETLRQRSRNVLTAILHNYADFSISTIDKFTHKIVRTFAHDLRLNVGFEVELDEKSLLRRSVDQLIAKAGTEKALTSLLVDFTQSKMEDDRNWQIEQDLLEFSSIILEEDAPANLAKLNDVSTEDFFRVRKEIKARIQVFREKVVEFGDRGLSLLTQSGIDHTSLAGGANGIGKYFTYLSTFRMDKLSPSSTVQKNVEQDKWFATKATAGQRSKIEALSAQLSALFHESSNYIEQHFPSVNLLLLIGKNIFSLALLNRIEQEFESVKNELNLLPISDFNKKISDVVMREPIPFIYERIGERYHHFLIDEFQDTSLLQWQNLLPLIENALGGGHFNMVVGDAKQAIYRWRGGEVEQFVKLPDIHKPMNEDFAVHKQMSLNHHYEPKMLVTNYRSKMEVVDFNNRFFESLMPLMSEYGTAIYQYVKQEYDERNTGGGVCIQIMEDIPDKGPGDVVCERVLEIVKENLATGYAYADIAVLCKKNSEGSMIAQYLLRNEVPVISSESLLLASSTEVGMVINIIRLLGDPHNHFICARIIEFLIVNGYMDGPLFEKTGEFLNSHQDIFEYMQQLGINLSRSELELLPLYELAETTMRAFGWMDKADPYLQSLLDVIYGYSNKEGNERTSFLEWWGQKQTNFSVQVPEGTRAVNVMTVHKSKGLEFPVVIHPFANYDARIQRSHAWVDVTDEKLEPLSAALIPMNKQVEQTRFRAVYREEEDKSLLDMFNVLYVALTRPRERLYVLTTPPSNTRKNRSVPDLLAYFYESTDAYRQNPGSMVFGTFEQDIKPVSEESVGQELIMDRFESADWKERITVSYRSPLLWEQGESADARSFGNLIHEVLSDVRTLSDVEPGMYKLQLSGLVTPEECREITGKIMRVLNDDEIKPYYEEGLKVINEADIVTPEGMGYRPDRVIIREQEVVVIDYKTGLEDSKHIKQLQMYRQVMTDMGYGTVEAYLVYIGGMEKIIKVA